MKREAWPRSEAALVRYYNEVYKKKLDNLKEKGRTKVKGVEGGGGGKIEEEKEEKMGK